MVTDADLTRESKPPELAILLEQGRLWAMTGVAGFLLAGAFVFRSDWTLWQGLFWGSVGLMAAGWHRDVLSVWRESLLFRGAVCWLLWMLGVSFLLGGLGENEAKSYQNWCWGGVGLVAWWVMLYHTGRDAIRTQILGWMVITAAAYSALASILHYGFLMPDWHWGKRLGNVLVYGGWNQVCSGLTWAFAAIWALLLGLRGEQNRWLRWLAWCAHGVLVFAALATLSRGALLVLVVGHGAALIYGGRKNGGGVAFLRFLTVFAIFHAVLPGTLPEEDGSGRYPRVIDSNPLVEWSRRADTGRLAMYEAVGRAMQAGGATMWFAGDGQWALNSRWNQPIEEAPHHPHSVFVATALHGGLMGLAGLLLILGLGLKQGHELAGRAGGSAWPLGVVLALAGLSGVVFDGHSLASLDSVPRFEPLIVWPGLLLAAGRRTQAGRLRI